MPQLEGKEEFKGSVLHSGTFYDPGDYAGKEVVVVGSGISGVDVASVLASHARRVTLLSRHGMHLFPQFMAPGKSWEWILFSNPFNQRLSPAQQARRWLQLIEYPNFIRTLHT